MRWLTRRSGRWERRLLRRAVVARCQHVGGYSAARSAGHLLCVTGTCGLRWKMYTNRERIVSGKQSSRPSKSTRYLFVSDLIGNPHRLNKGPRKHRIGSDSPHPSSSSYSYSYPSPVMAGLLPPPLHRILPATYRPTAASPAQPASLLTAEPTPASCNLTPLSSS